MPSDNKGSTANELYIQLRKNKSKKRLRTEDIDPPAILKSAAHQISPTMGRWVKTLWNAGNIIGTKRDSVTDTPTKKR